MELQQYIQIVLKRWWLIALTTVLAAVAAAGVSYTTTPIFTATATLMVDTKSDPYEAAYWTNLNAQATAGAYAVQATSPVVAARTASRMPGSMTAEEVQGAVSATQVAESGMIELSARHPNPAVAYALVDNLSEAFIAHIAAQEADRYAGAIDEIESQITELEEEITELRISIAAFGDAGSLAPIARAEMARLQTQANNDQTRLTVLLNSAEQFRLAIARASGSISVFQPPMLPIAPTSPRPLRNIGLATVVGGMVGVGIAFLLDYLDDTVRTPIDVQQVLGANVLGAIPLMDEDCEACPDVAASQPLSPTAEAMRDLRTSLQYASLDAPLRTLLVTSTAPNEGKSFVASNLGTAMALAGSRVLLMEGDLRRPDVHRTWGTSRTPGLTDALRDFSDAVQRREGSGSREPTADEDTAVRSTGRSSAPLAPDAASLAAYTQATDVENLYLLTAGTRISTPSELLSSQTFQRMLATLLTVFDTVILDTPPILNVTDAAVLAGYVDGVVVVVASGKSRLPLAARTLERIEAVGGNLLGVVVNQLTSRSGGYYYRHYQYGYGYGHREAAQASDQSRVTSHESGVPAALPIQEPVSGFLPSRGDGRGGVPASHIVSLGTLRRELTLDGHLATDRRLTLTFPVAGTVDAVHVAQGEPVAEGTLLVELDAPAEEQALLRAKSEVTVARLELARVEASLAARTGAQAPPVASAESEIDEYDLAIVRERLRLATELQAHAQTRHRQTRLVAPFDGVLLDFGCAPGAAVAAHQPLGVLADVSRLRAWARLDGAQPAETPVAPGAYAIVRPEPGVVDAEWDGLALTGSVVTVAQEPASAGDPAGSAGGNGRPVTAIEIELDQGQDLPPIAQAAATVTVHTETHADVPWVPAAALTAVDDAMLVDLQTPTGVERVPVEIGILDGDRAEILSGLAVGDEVVLG